MKLTRALQVSARIACVVFIATIGGRASFAADLTVLYTANTNGKMEACACPGDPYGGLVERVSLVRAMRERGDKFLLVDCGNAVSLFGQYGLRAACIMRLMNLMKYDVMALGQCELFNGVGPAAGMQAVASFPFVSSVTGQGASVFEPSVRVDVGGVEVLVVAVTDSVSGYVPVESRRYDYGVPDPFAALAKTLAGEATADFIIVLSQMDHKKNTELVRRFPAIDLVVQGHGNEAYEQPVETPNGVIVSPGSRGKNVGQIRLRSTGTSTTVTSAELIPVLDIPADPQAARIVDDYRASIR